MSGYKMKLEASQPGAVREHIAASLAGIEANLNALASAVADMRAIDLTTLNEADLKGYKLGVTMLGKALLGQAEGAAGIRSDFFVLDAFNEGVDNGSTHREVAATLALGNLHKVEMVLSGSFDSGVFGAMSTTPDLQYFEERVLFAVNDAAKELIKIGKVADFAVAQAQRLGFDPAELFETENPEAMKAFAKAVAIENGATLDASGRIIMTEAQAQQFYDMQGDPDLVSPLRADAPLDGAQGAATLDALMGSEGRVFGQERRVPRYGQEDSIVIR